MTLQHLARRSFRFYFRSHLGVLAGAALAATVLIGALAVGDSVRESLRQHALKRLFGTVAALGQGDAFFTQTLAERMVPAGQPYLVDGMPVWFRIPGQATPLRQALSLAATLTRQDGSARANAIRVIGVDPSDYLSGFTVLNGQRLLDFSNDQVWVNQALADHLHAKVGDPVVLRFHKPSAVSRDAVISPRDDLSVALRMTVGGILPTGGDFSLEANQSVPFNAFVSKPRLAEAAGLAGRVNLLLSDSVPLANVESGSWRTSLRSFIISNRRYLSFLYPLVAAKDRRQTPEEQSRFLGEKLAQSWTLEDAELAVRPANPPVSQTGGEEVPKSIELSTRRIFLEEPVVRAATKPALENLIPKPTPILTYLVNSIEHGDRLTPYSMITAAGAPYTPADLHDDEIVVNEWLAGDLNIKAGDQVNIAYYRVDAGTRLVELTNSFKVRSIVPLHGRHADRTLMPEFPGLSKAESTRDWDAGFDLVHPIRAQDEAYWKQWRGTPKAFITLAAGQAMWGNRFGNLTAIRWEAGGRDVSSLHKLLTNHIRTNLNPADVGLQFRDVLTPALAAIDSGTGKEFGGLMIGFGFFLIVSALLLTAMLFSFSLEQRALEIGTLLAIGWHPKRVRRVLFHEGLQIAFVGSLLGTVGGIAYAKGVLWGLATLWRDAVGGAGLQFFVTPETLVGGFFGSIVVASLTLALTLRRQTNRPARELLNEGASETVWQDPAKRSRWPLWVAWICGVGGIGLAGASIAVHDSNPETYFSAGSLLLIGVLLGVREWMARPVSANRSPVSLTSLAFRGITRRRRRSLGTISLLGSAAFLIVAVATNRLDARRDATQRSSGTGGFALWAESSLPVIQDLNSRKGQDFYGLDPKVTKEVSFVPMRVRDGDDASCLNLNRAQQPKLLGVNPDLLARRGAFTFTAIAKGITVTNGWLALGPGFATNQAGVDIIPAIGDANSLQWALQKSPGDTLEYIDQKGRPFKVRIVGAVANSILQGSLIISEADFVKHFPNESGYRALLVDAPAAASGEVAAHLSRALQDTGLEVVSTATRLDRFNAVQNTYLNTFQILGGLGLLLGSVGLGVVVARNVFERRGELAVLQAMGFEAHQLRRFILLEHGALLVLGLAGGLIAALLTVLPALLTPGSEFPWTSIGITLAIVAMNGLAWTWIATRRALNQPLLDSLKAL
jgi:ABC-type lipoprotein release transport system permease subunit